MRASTKMFCNIPVSMSKFLTIFTIKCDPCCISTVWRHSNLRTRKKTKLSWILIADQNLLSAIDTPKGFYIYHQATHCWFVCFVLFVVTKHCFVLSGSKVETKVKPYLEFRACWNNNWSEREWVWADGCDQDSRNRGVNQWGTGRHRVGCWSGWRGNYQAITLNRDMLGKYLNFALLKFVLDWQFVLVLSWLLRCGSRVGTLQPRYMSWKASLFLVTVFLLIQVHF